MARWQLAKMKFSLLVSLILTFFENYRFKSFGDFKTYLVYINREQINSYGRQGA